MKLKSDQAEHERLLHVLVDVAASEEWRPALGILQVHHSFLRLGDSKRLVFATVSSPEGPIETLEYLDGRSTSALRRLFNENMERFAVEFGKHIDLSQADSNAQPGSPEANRAILAGVKLAFEDRSIHDMFTRTLVSSAEHISTVTATEVLNAIRRKAELIERVFPDEPVVAFDQLVKLGLLTPWIASSACPRCLAHEFTVSPIQRTATRCPRCRSTWFTASLGLFREDYELIKNRDEDLALFIAAYLRTRVAGRAAIHPSAVFDLDGATQEVDVFIQADHSIGIECKALTEASLLTTERTDAIVGTLKRQAEAYARLGINEATFIVNTSEKGTQALDERLRAAVAGRLQVTVLSAEPGVLLPALNALAERLEQHVGQRIEHQLRSSRTPVADETAEASPTDASPAQGEPATIVVELETLTGWRGQPIVGARSRGANRTFYAKDWRDMVLDAEGEILRKSAHPAKRAWFADEVHTVLAETHGVCSAVQSINSEDTVTWTVFGHRVPDNVVSAILDVAFGAATRPTSWERMFWEKRWPNPDGGHPPEPDIVLRSNGWCFLVEAKWRAEIDQWQGAKGDRDQLAIRAHIVEREVADRSRRGVLVVLPGPDRYPHASAAGFSKYFVVERDAYVPTDAADAIGARAITWERVLTIVSDSSPDIADYLRWRLDHLPPAEQ